MRSMTVRNLPDEVHDELRQRAQKNGRSVEAEVRTILEHAVTVANAGGFGQRLRARFGEDTGDDLSTLRDGSISDPAIFE